MKLLVPLLALLLLCAGCANQQAPAVPARAPAGANESMLQAKAAVHGLAMQHYNEGMACFEASDYTGAHGNFSTAQSLFKQAQDYEMAADAQDRMLRSMRTMYEYPIPEADARQLLAETFPDSPQEKINEWLANPVNYIMNGDERWYYGDLEKNVYFDEPELMHEKSRKAGKNAIYDALKDIAFNETEPDAQFVNPQEYEAAGKLHVPRESLPATGTLKLWIPVPIGEDSQKNVSVLYIAPPEYVRSVPDAGADVGIVYMEIPLEGLDKDLDVEVVSRFTAYEQRFAVDPEAVGEYDRQSPDYALYTRSDPETTITPEIEATARQVVGNETNPYLMAEKLYWHVVNGTTYNFMPHLSLYARGVSETLYAHEHRVGDCGTQSMYFSALCRAVGIPARTSGGYQMFPGHEGTHFWAKIYLPNYGWIPIDTTAAETGDWGYNVSEGDNARFKQFYFGNLDNYRMVIQKDVGLELVPPADRTLIFPIIIQNAQGSCDTAEGDIALALHDWKMEIRPV